MKIGRRNFIRGTAGSASASVLVKFIVPIPSVSAHAAIPVDRLARQPPAVERERLLFGIDGWERHDELASDTPVATPMASGTMVTSERQVWIGVTQSWRANWR
jgi:hypothetical protein